jgi:rubrerythrin
MVRNGRAPLAKNFKDLSEPEILALAISSEETDARIYADFAAALKADYPGTAQIFKEMEAEEDGAPPQTARGISSSLWRTHSFDPSRRC